MTYQAWRADDPSTHPVLKMPPPPPKAPKVYLMLSINLLDGPNDGQQASVVADANKLPPPTLTVAGVKSSVYRYSHDRGVYVWWTARSGVPVPAGIPLKVKP